MRQLTVCNNIIIRLYYEHLLVILLVLRNKISGIEDTPQIVMNILLNFKLFKQSFVPVSFCTPLSINKYTISVFIVYIDNYL